jgi:type II secretory pathway pseudopilin PulG
MKKYKAFTLLELVIVLVIVMIISMMSVLSYRSLVDSFSVNEVSLIIAQDIRGAQRSAMLMDRDPRERWLYGIGIDFTNLSTDRTYDIFKWCSSYDFYNERETRLNWEIPNWQGNLIDSKLEPSLLAGDDCERGETGSGRLVVETKRFGEYANLDFTLNTDVDYILFESVSGKTFFYTSSLEGALVNYEEISGDLYLKNELFLEMFDLELSSNRTRNEIISRRKIQVAPVSGIISFDYLDEED